MTTATSSQIAALRNEAAVNGDYRMACICSLALNGCLSTDESDPAYREALALEADGMTQEQAIAECAAVIAAADTQDDK